jgi:hypothetical protein
MKLKLRACSTFNMLNLLNDLPLLTTIEFHAIIVLNGYYFTDWYNIVQKNYSKNLKFKSINSFSIAGSFTIFLETFKPFHKLSKFNPKSSGEMSDFK